MDADDLTTILIQVELGQSLQPVIDAVGKALADLGLAGHATVETIQETRSGRVTAAFDTDGVDAIRRVCSARRADLTVTVHNAFRLNCRRRQPLLEGSGAPEIVRHDLQAGYHVKAVGDLAWLHGPDGHAITGGMRLERAMHLVRAASSVSERPVGNRPFAAIGRDRTAALVDADDVVYVSSMTSTQALDFAQKVGFDVLGPDEQA